MKTYQTARRKTAARLSGLIMALVMAVSMVSMAAWAAGSYTTCAKGTVSWQMIYQNPDTYYWKDSSGEYCALKAAARQAIVSAGGYGSASGSGSESDTGSGSEGGYTPVTESEIGKGVGEKTGTKYTGKGVIADEYLTLDVYVSGGKITGLFIADEVGDWLNLLTQESTNYIGKSAEYALVNAVSSATTLGFRNTIRDAVANAVQKIESSGGSSSGSAASYKVDGYDKKYSYSALNSGRYYFLYKEAIIR